MTCETFQTMVSSYIGNYTTAEVIASANHKNLCNSCQQWLEEGEKEAEKLLSPLEMAILIMISREQARKVLNDKEAMDSYVQPGAKK